MSEPQPTSYDELPYVDRAFYYTHPDWLATIATLFGMKPAPVDRCRVLELGCGSGGNLLPMAQSLPQSRFLGIDLSGRQVACGQAIVETLGLRNIELKAMSIMDVDAGFGHFDYIICHGVFSWVPEEVQEKILAICKENLATQGVAYVSYNTYPGWHLRGMVRDMLCFHSSKIADPQVRVQQARTFLDFLIQAVPDKAHTVYGTLLKEEAELLAPEADAYVFHEHLEDVNQPLYFHQFIVRATALGLQYLDEARFNALAVNLPAEVKNVVAQFSRDHLDREQYFDFICRRTFRRTLLCHDFVTLTRPPNPETVDAFHVTAVAKPVSPQPDIHSNSAEQFCTHDNVSLSTNRPLAKAALVILAEFHPRSVPLANLWELARARLGKSLEEDPAALANGQQLLAQFLWQCYASNLVELQTQERPFVTGVSDRPRATPLARLQAGADSRVTNCRHRGIELSAFDRLVLQHLDGSHDLVSLLNRLTEMVSRGDFEIHKGDRPVQDADSVREILSETLDHSLRGLARHALLVG